jgi:hypothetical protein
MKYGFALRRLTLIGPGKPPSEVVFTRGLNVIVGASDTGKSFIVQCINYALGGGDSPKYIPEAEGYSSIFLMIESNQNQRVYTLERSLHGGNIRCRTRNEPERKLAAKHQGGNENTISHFLLDLSGLGNKSVLTNQDGKTRPLSFRDIARLVIVDEESVIKEISPVLSGQVIHKTVESSVFRLLLTGVDDSSVVAKEDPKVAKGRQAGRAEVLESLLENVRKRIDDVGEVGTIGDERDRILRIEMALQAAIADRDAAQASAAPIENNRRAAWTALRTVDSKLNVLSELQMRFDLLQEQYSSDLRRLEAIAEAGVRLDQLHDERCSVCGARAEHHEYAHREARFAPSDVSLACKAEAAKIWKLHQDLLTTCAATAADVKQLSDEREKWQKEFDVISAELKTLLEQHVEVANKKVDELRSRSDASRRVLELLEQLQELEALLERSKPLKKLERAESAISGVSTGQAEPFSMQVEALLRAWHFPGIDRVSFSENDQDVIISGQPRKSHGKGVRAIIRAAFNLALLRLCAEGGRPFPNFVLIDSPLLVYEEPDVDEAAFSQDIKKHFWESVKVSFMDTQVIIIENTKQLPSDGLGDANVVLFTGTDQGRRGFVPAG